MNNKQIFAINLEKYLQDKNMTKAELARILKYPETTVSNWANAVNYPRIDKIQEIADFFGIKKSDLTEYKDETQNELTFVGNIVSSSNQKYIPFVPDVIAAGIPSTIEGIMQLDTIAVPFEFLGKHKNNKNLIAMKVSGESMNKIIPNGSYIIMRTDIKFSSLKDGDIVVFDKEHEYSLKHFYKTEDKLIFRPNSTEKSFVDITYDINDKVNIRGKVISHIVFDE